VQSKQRMRKWSRKSVVEARVNYREEEIGAKSHERKRERERERAEIERQQR
jgi:hypothetical protein